MSICREMTLKEEIECLLINESVKQRMLEKLERIDERSKALESHAHDLRLENSKLYEKIRYYRGALILLAKETPDSNY